MGRFNLIEVTTWAGLTVYYSGCHYDNLCVTFALLFFPHIFIQSIMPPRVCNFIAIVIVHIPCIKCQI